MTTIEKLYYGHIHLYEKLLILKTFCRFFQDLLLTLNEELTRRLPKCFPRMIAENQKMQFGNLTGFIIADKNVPAEEIKIDIWGRFEKKRSCEANEIKGFEIGKKQRQA